MFTLNNVAVDGLGRLKGANETITKADSNTISHSYIFAYDMRSQLTNANISNINGGNWVAKYSYHDNGDMVSRTVQANQTGFTYSGNKMITVGGNNLSYDENGNMTSGVDATLAYNWDNKLRSATKGTKSISLKYDPSGNRIYKNSSEAGNRKYIVDIVGDLPVILLELNPNNMNIEKTYVYANSQILAEHNGNYSTPRYFYLHDRLGSVRQVINSNAVVVRMFTFSPFGETIEEQGSFYTPWQFTGQYLDSETEQYYLRARQYDPYIARFTNRDAADGKFDEPMSLHKYLYCENEPVNRIDPAGLWYEYIHRSFGRYGWCYDEKRGLALFDYARLDYDKPAWMIWKKGYLELHFRSKDDIYPDLLRAIGEGDRREFEYLVHQWQDTYTHFDRGYTKDTKGHGMDPSIDDVNWNDPADVAAYRACDATTRMFEDLWFKCNIWDWIMHPEVELPTKNPWLSTGGTWAE